MKRNTPVKNPHEFVPLNDSAMMNKLRSDLKLELTDFVNYLNLNLSYGVRREMQQGLFNPLLYRTQPIEYQDRFLYQVIFAMECRHIHYAEILALAKNFIETVDAMRGDEVYETEVF